MICPSHLNARFLGLASGAPLARAQSADKGLPQVVAFTLSLLLACERTSYATGVAVLVLPSLRSLALQCYFSAIFFSLETSSSFFPTRPVHGIVRAHAQTDGRTERPTAGWREPGQKLANICLLATCRPNYRQLASIETGDVDRQHSLFCLCKLKTMSARTLVGTAAVVWLAFISPRARFYIRNGRLTTFHCTTRAGLKYFARKLPGRASALLLLACVRSQLKARH